MRERVMDMRGRGHAGGEYAGVWQAGQRQTRIAPPPDRIHSPSRCPLRGRVLGSASAASRLVSRQAHAPVPKAKYKATLDMPNNELIIVLF